jgi:LPXTG-motif cell wall-anchored protein
MQTMFQREKTDNTSDDKTDNTLEDNIDDVPEDNTDDVPEDNIDDVPEDNTGDIPETGDNSNITLVFVLILLSGAGILATVLNSKRRQYKLEKK